ncbi:MAG: ABC transporter ATP-binding protein [Gammaproteobacteria bacterium]
MKSTIGRVPIVEATGLHTHYGASHILHGIDLTVYPGETVSLLGRNGMGKTTTLRTILGLTPPSKGKVLINGKDMTGFPTHRIIRQGIAYVPENREIFPTLSVFENLVMAERPGVDGSRDWTLDRVYETFPRLYERRHHMGDQLSGGEQQMLTFGRALMTNPSLIILDEATEGLAPLVRKEIWAVIRTIKETGIACIIIDKEIKALLSVTERNIIISKGRIVYQGSSEELAAQPDIHKRYMGV